jgi:hypothetical protein
MISTKQGDLYNDEALRRDFMQLWNTGRFDDIRLEVEPGSIGLILRFVLTERRVVRTIDYKGIHSVTVSEILDRFKERKVGLSVESQYDPNKVQRAVVALKEFLGERGHAHRRNDRRRHDPERAERPAHRPEQSSPGRLQDQGRLAVQRKNSKPLPSPASHTACRGLLRF